MGPFVVVVGAPSFSERRAYVRRARRQCWRHRQIECPRDLEVNLSPRAARADIEQSVVEIRRQSLKVECDPLGAWLVAAPVMTSSGGSGAS